MCGICMRIAHSWILMHRNRFRNWFHFLFRRCIAIAKTGLKPEGMRLVTRNQSGENNAVTRPCHVRPRTMPATITVACLCTYVLLPARSTDPRFIYLQYHFYRAENWHNFARPTESATMSKRIFIIYSDARMQPRSGRAQTTKSVSPKATTTKFTFLLPWHFASSDENRWQQQSIRA